MAQIHEASQARYCAYFEREHRYYVITLEQDLLNDWVVRREYGGKGQKRRGLHQEGYREEAYSKAFAVYQRYYYHRLHVRKYQLKS